MTDELHERGPDGLLTPWALACQALIDHNCPTADEGNPQSCPICVAYDAMGAEHRRAVQGVGRGGIGRATE